MLLDIWLESSVSLFLKSQVCFASLRFIFSWLSSYVCLVPFPILCLVLTNEHSLPTLQHSLLLPCYCDFWFSVLPTFVAFWCWSSCATSRLALDNSIRHKQLNISSRFSPRVAGENDFLQTVINKVIAAKEVNHKGQGRYFVSFLHYYYLQWHHCFNLSNWFQHWVKGFIVSSLPHWEGDSRPP